MERNVRRIPKIGDIIESSIPGAPIAVRRDRQRGGYLTKLYKKSSGGGWVAMATDRLLGKKGLICFLKQVPEIWHDIKIINAGVDGNWIAGELVVNKMKKESVNFINQEEME